MAVSPFLSMAFTSAPRSNATWTASNTSLSVPASSPGERVASPAAAIRGVLLSAFGTSGSAPKAASVLINSASAVRAASRKGVAPSSLSRVFDKFARFVILAFTFAPRAASVFTSSILLMFPDPSGAGSLSPTPGLRTAVIAWRIVYPGRLAFGSAPASTSWRQSPAVAAPASALDRYGLVHVRPCLQQDPNDVGAPFSDGKQQRRKPGGQTVVKIGSDLDEHLHNPRVTFRRRPHQGRLPAPIIFIVNSG